MAKNKNNTKAEISNVDALAIAVSATSTQQAEKQAQSAPQAKEGLRKAYLRALPFPQTCKLNKRMLAVCAYVLCGENKAIAAKLLAYTICNEKIGYAGQALVGECGDNSGMQGYVKPSAAWFTKIQAQGVCATHTAYLRDTAQAFGVTLPQA